MAKTPPETPTNTTTKLNMSLRPRSTTKTKTTTMVTMNENNNNSTKRTKRPTAPNKNKKKNKGSDAFKPKKPPTAFFYYLEDFRKEFQEQNPHVKSMSEVGKACGEKWKTMTYEEKIQYYDIATEKRAKFEKDMMDYVKKKENGEYDEFDEDSEYDD